MTLNKLVDEILAWWEVWRQVYPKLHAKFTLAAETESLPDLLIQLAEHHEKVDRLYCTGMEYLLMQQALEEKTAVRSELKWYLDRMPAQLQVAALWDEPFNPEHAREFIAARSLKKQRQLLQEKPTCRRFAVFQVADAMKDLKEYIQTAQSVGETLTQQDIRELVEELLPVHLLR